MSTRWGVGTVLFGSFLVLVLGCASNSIPTSVVAKPPQIPAPPPAMFSTELKPSGYYSEKLMNWRLKAQSLLIPSGMNSLSAGDTPKQ